MLPRLTGIHAALPIPVHIIATVSPAWTMDSLAPAPSPFSLLISDTGLERLG